jgi:uncharacterized protein YjaG (DUF416 family)
MTLKKDELTQKLSTRDPRAVVAFSASCASRLIENYESFSKRTGFGDASLLRDALSFAWRVAEGDGRDCGQPAKDYLKRCAGLTPDTEAFPGGGVSAALDASCAVLETLDCIVAVANSDRWESATHAAEAATAALDTADMIDERRPVVHERVTTQGERERQASLLMLLDHERPAEEIVARAKVLGSARDLVVDA